MEQWEIDLRAKLEKELYNGYYQIDGGTGGYVMYIGKQGMIEFEVALRKEANKYYENMPILKGKDIEDRMKESSPKYYTDLTEQDIIDFMDMLQRKEDGK